MDSFDIIWLAVSIGIPVLSWLLSSGKKKPAKESPKPQNGGRRGLADVLRDIVLEMADADVDTDSDDSGDGEPVLEQPASEVSEGGLDSEVHRQPVLADTVPSEKPSEMLPASAYVVRPPISVADRKDDIAADIDAGAEAPACDMARKRTDKERIDPEKLVVYTAIMNPKFKEL